MRRTHPFRPLAATLVLLAACSDGGAPARMAEPEELRIQVVQGRAIRATVRDPATPASDPGLLDSAVVVRITAVPFEGRGDITGTSSRKLRIPDVEVRWRTLEPYCRVDAATTPVTGDSAVNRYRRPTTAGPCRLMAEGVAGGRVFGADTAVAGFEAGPVVSFSASPRNAFLLVWPLRAFELVDDPRDHWGNAAESFTVTARLREAGVLTLSGDTLRARGEGTGQVTLSIGSVSRDTELWALNPLSAPRVWRLSWACYGGTLPDGTAADSAHFRVDSALATYGRFSAPGLYLSFTGPLTTRVWPRGAPARQTLRPGYVLAGVQRPHQLMWGPGQVSEATARGYEGGSACQAADGGTWTRGGPMRVDRL